MFKMLAFYLTNLTFFNHIFVVRFNIQQVYYWRGGEKGFWGLKDNDYGIVLK